ncbi:MAG: hypothetical protein A4E63_02062 [Syntrophorhabdus sp. PtaU1.Bin050]|jgi:hypothetical protein|nr:MAG: hypothetical protein A4E63_02062 [Syntrophorhabdus sp. PtaU1.Bin050]
MVIRSIGSEDIPNVVEIMLLNWDGVMAKRHSPNVGKKFKGEVTPDWPRITWSTSVTRWKT